MTEKKCPHDDKNINVQDDRGKLAHRMAKKDALAMAGYFTR
jgi:hypothetical protein